jgi:sortase A
MRLPGGNGRFREGPLFKVGAILIIFALALTIVALVVTFALRAEPERTFASESAKPSNKPLRYGQPLAEKPESQPKPQSSSKPAGQKNPEQSSSPPTQQGPWPTPTKEQLAIASEPRYYDLPPGAIMGLTIPAIGIYNAPVFDSDGQWALTNGVGHVPDTSLPWSETPQRNVYIEGHRIGWPATGSHLVFYHLNKLSSGDEVVLKNRDGEAYSYRVSEKLRVNPDDVWVMGQVVGRDMVTLQTCTPIPTFEKRLIVRADRV